MRKCMIETVYLVKERDTVVCNDQSANPVFCVLHLHNFSTPTNYVKETKFRSELSSRGTIPIERGRRS